MDLTGNPVVDADYMAREHYYSVLSDLIEDMLILIEKYEVSAEYAKEIPDHLQHAIDSSNQRLLTVQVFNPVPEISEK